MTIQVVSQETNYSSEKYNLTDVKKEILMMIIGTVYYIKSSYSIMLFIIANYFFISF